MGTTTEITVESSTTEPRTPPEHAQDDEQGKGCRSEQEGATIEMAGKVH